MKGLLLITFAVSVVLTVITITVLELIPRATETREIGYCPETLDVFYAFVIFSIMGIVDIVLIATRVVRL